MKLMGLRSGVVGVACAMVVGVGDVRQATAQNESDLFSGLIWTGEEGIALGLVDALGSSSYVAREIVGAEEIVDFTPSRSYLELLADRFGTSMGSAVAARLELRNWHLR